MLIKKYEPYFTRNIIMAVGVKAHKITTGLNGDDGAWDFVCFR